MFQTILTNIPPWIVYNLELSFKCIIPNRWENMNLGGLMSYWTAINCVVLNTGKKRSQQWSNCSLLFMISLCKILGHRTAQNVHDSIWIVDARMSLNTWCGLKGKYRVQHAQYAICNKQRPGFKCRFIRYFYTNLSF